MLGKKEKKEQRFEIVTTESAKNGGFVQILRDRQTGVQYLFYSIMQSGGLYPLLDGEGNAVVDKG